MTIKAEIDDVRAEIEMLKGELNKFKQAAICHLL
jgi:hypothetical protein